MPFIGLPTFWKTGLAVVIGAVLVFSSIELIVPKRNIKSRVKKEKVDEMTIESIPVYPKDNLVESIPSEFVKPERKRSPRKVKLTE